MLSSLSIRDIVLIRSLDLEFGDGMAVLSGETGAGKSILLDSLSLALGARGDGDLVRVGCAQGQVTAIFEVADDHPVFELLGENDLESNGEGGQIMLRRVQNADGRTRAYVNDRPVSVGTLKQFGQMLVEIHGQHEERAMIDPTAHRDLVDAFGKLEPQVEAVEKAYDEWHRADRELRETRTRVERAAKDAAMLRDSVEELTALDPKPDEEDVLASRRQTMMQAEKIASDINEAHDTLAGNSSPVPILSSLARRLERKAAEAPGLLDDAVQGIDRALDALAEAEDALQHAMRLSEFDPYELENAEERLFALRAASRKFGVPVVGLTAHAEKLTKDLEALDAGESRLGELEAQAAEKRAALTELALELSHARKVSGEALSQRIARELPALKLEQARFFAQQTRHETEISAQGCDTIEFHVQTNPSTRPGPLMKVASGGELSRFLLALKVALADRGSAPTLVFDEIDTGAGGAVADAIGTRLSTLADHVQVLSVTHAPQVASRANHHFLISKAPTKDESVETSVAEITEGTRQEEIARMLSGAVVSEEARAAAGKLLSDRMAA